MWQSFEESEAKAVETHFSSTMLDNSASLAIKLELLVPSDAMSLIDVSYQTDSKIQQLTVLFGKPAISDIVGVGKRGVAI